MDEVDQILTAWQAERPDLDVSPMAVWSRVSRLAGIVDERRAAVLKTHGLLPYEFDVLTALRRAGTPYELTAGQLVTATHVTSGTMTNRIDRLTDKKWVTRRADAVDGRVVRVRLGPPGRRKVDGALASLLAQERALLDGLSDTAQVRLASQLRNLLETFESGRTA